MTTLPATFWIKVNTFGPIPAVRPDLGSCWVWKNCVTSRGYGSFQIERRRQSTHRLAYADAKGPIPDGLTVDHLCLNKRCCNPDHLEAVTMAENLRRARVTRGLFEGGACRSGHPLSSHNLRKTPRGELICRTCRADYMSAWKAKAAA